MIRRHIYTFVRHIYMYICFLILRHIHRYRVAKTHRIPYKLQVIFHQRTTIHKALMRKMTYRNKASYDFTTPCMYIQPQHVFLMWRESMILGENPNDPHAHARINTIYVICICICIGIFFLIYIYHLY